ncbi:MAG: FecR family protein [Gammaproteobacteria bacterium]
MPTHPSDIPKHLSDEAIAWVVRVHSDRCTERDRAHLAAWRALGAAHEQAYLEASRLWQDMGTALCGDRGAAVPVETGARPPAQRRGLLQAGWALAASLAAIAVPHHFHYTDRWLSDYHTATGEQALVRLADGSTALLNTDTALSLAGDKETRRLRLHHGQALFTVAPDRARPFEVEAAGGRIRALGTVFEVYENAGQVEITVHQHAVRVHLGLEAGEVFPAIAVSAGERLRYDSAGRTQAPEKIDVREHSAWQRRKLLFKDRPLAEVIGEVNRYRRGRIVIANPHLHDLRVTGLFPTGDPEAVLKLIRETLPVQTTRIAAWLVFLHQ